MSYDTCQKEKCSSPRWRGLPNCFRHRGRQRTDTCCVVGCENKRLSTYKECSRHFIEVNSKRICVRDGCENLRYGTSHTCLEHKQSQARELYYRDHEKTKKRNTEKRAYLKCLYGLSLEDYNKKLEQQNFQCAICRSDLNLANRGAHVDHDHVTQKVRDILCPRCNVVVGALENNAEHLYKYIEYLERHESSETLRLTSSDNDKVRSAWRHAESGRNDRVTSDAMLLVG